MALALGGSFGRRWVTRSQINVRTPKNSVADGLFKDFSDLYFPQVNAITVIAYG